MHPRLALTDVLSIPSFPFNLLSVDKLTKGINITFIFYSTHCLVQDQQTREILAISQVLGTLYVLNSHSSNSATIRKYFVAHLPVACNITDLNSCNKDSDVNRNNIDSHHLWHRRLGHASFSTLQHIPSIKVPSLVSNGICNVCHFAKQQRLPFPENIVYSANILELMHIDI